MAIAAVSGCAKDPDNLAELPEFVFVAETFAADISSLQGQQRFFFVSSFEVDGSGNLYICADSLDAGGQQIYVLDSAGALQFQLEPIERVEQFVKLPDGSVAIPAVRPDGTGANAALALQTIDFAARAFGEAVSLPDVGRTVYPGSGDYDILISDGMDIYGFTIGEEEPVKLLSWMDSDVANDNISGLAMLSGEQIICTKQKYDVVTYRPVFEVYLLTKTPRSQLPEKTVLTLGTFNTFFVSDAVDEFNRASSDCRIYVIDYSSFNTENDSYAGHARLRTEIISGAGPDILDVRMLNYKELVTKGLLTDLNPFIDKDPEISRDDFVQGVFEAVEVDGGLYQVFWQFMVNTVIGNPSVVGEDPGWTIDEFFALLDANPGADIPLGAQIDKMAFLEMMVLFYIDEYIDWQTGVAYFDTPDFIRLMECAGSRFPDEPDNLDYDVDLTVEAIATGRQIMMPDAFYRFSDSQYNKMRFGGEIVFKGFPSESGSGNTLRTNPGLAIMEQSENKEAAWSFLRMTLGRNWQSQNAELLPTNQAVFDQRVRAALEQQPESGETTFSYPVIDDSGDVTYVEQQVKNLTQEDVDKMIDAISSVSGTMSRNLDEAIWNIISESASDYFNGACSAEDAARVIQSKISILVSERS